MHPAFFAKVVFFLGGGGLGAGFIVGRTPGTRGYYPYYAAKVSDFGGQTC